jgi:hypothetical protein
MLIKKFVYEYFYVIPDSADVARRRRNDSFMARICAGKVFRDWEEKVVPELEKMSHAKVLRNVRVHDNIQERDDYFYVEYDLQEWDKSNGIDEMPTVHSNQVMFLKLEFIPGIREHTPSGLKFDIKKYLKSGGDPAAIFKFMVMKVIIK